MKRGICINSSPMAGDSENQPVLTEGKSYNIVNEWMGYEEDGYLDLCYELEEIGDEFLYQRERFILTSTLESNEDCEIIEEELKEEVDAYTM